MKSDDIDRIIEEMITDKNSLRKAAEMALGALDSDNPDIQLRAAIALRQALEDRPPVKSYAGGKPNYCTPEVTCKTDPQAPHGFDRNASHSADRYVCECESWEPADAVNMTPDRVDETAKGEHDILGSEWVECVKLPIVVHVRNQREGETHISTREGITPVLPDDLIMRGVAGEEYPIGRGLFERTYTFDTAPPKKEWVGLTDEEIIECFDSVALGQVENDLIINKHVNIFTAIRSIEAKLKEKNT